VVYESLHALGGPTVPRYGRFDTQPAGPIEPQTNLPFGPIANRVEM
jgi:hypothetical protein